MNPNAFEDLFGFRGQPFQLSPDPRAFFASREHAHAMVALNFGVGQGEGFVLVTGEIGAGKTTLVRAMLAGLDNRKIIAGQVLSTQHDALELLGAIALAFGIEVRGRSKARTIATLEAFFVAAAAGGRRALLVVDEAQNLGRDGLEELRMLTNLQIGTTPLLQCVLVGQPELRALLTGPEMEQLRQRVLVACHLGAMGRSETRSYIEHRLHSVGWTGTPSFDEAAFEEIHAATDGIPRRIHRLCTRLLATCQREGLSSVRRASVSRVAGELRSELGPRPSERRLSLWR